MADGKLAERLPEELLLEDYYGNLHDMYSDLRAVFKCRTDEGLTQDKIAARLGIDKALVSKRLNGRKNLTLKTLSAMASAMECRVVICLKPYEAFGNGSNYYFSWDRTATISTSAVSTGGASDSASADTASPAKVRVKTEFASVDA